jgi:hypothetical protein
VCAVGSAVAGVAYFPIFRWDDDLFDDVSDFLDFSVEDLIGIGEFDLSGFFLDWGNRSQSDVSLVSDECGSAFFQDVRFLRALASWVDPHPGAEIHARRPNVS